jgi:S1-C subfamily serine protease
MLGGVVVVFLLTGYHLQNARLRRQIEDIDHMRSRVGEIALRIDSVIGRSRNADAFDHDLEAVRSETAQIRKQIVRVRDAVGETNREARDAMVALTERIVPDSQTLSDELLAPAVLLTGPDTFGSGTLVCSRIDPSTGEVLNYVLTAWHVVRNMMAGDSENGVEVTVYQPPNEPVEVSAEVVAKAVEIDAALLRLHTDVTFEHVARVLSPADERSVAVWDPIYTVGCPLGTDPAPTTGVVSSTRHLVRGTNYWMINAPTYYGNSGGGVFLADSRHLIGVFSKVYTYRSDVVTHMGLMVPITAVQEWLEREGLDHLLRRQGHAVALGDLSRQRWSDPATNAENARARGFPLGTGRIGAR